MKKGPWDFCKNGLDRYPIHKHVLNYDKFYKKYQKIFDKRLSQCEILAIDYCLETIPFYKNKTKNFQIVKYEDIIQNPDLNFKKICEENNLNYSSFNFNNLKIQSSTTLDFDLKNQVEKWKNNIGPTQYNSITNIFDFFEISDFLNELEYLQPYS